MITKLTKVIVVLSFVALFASCTVAQNINFTSSSDNSGNADLEFSAGDFFVTVLEDLTAWQENTSKDDILDTAVESVEASIALCENISGLEFEKTGVNSYNGTFCFEDFTTFARDITEQYPNQKLLLLTEEDGVKTFLLNIDLDTYDVLAKVVPILDDDNFKVWGPVYNNAPYDEISEEDYKDMVAWTLGEDGPDAIDESVITIKIHTPSAIISTNGNMLDDYTAEFSFPLIDFLLLHNPIVFYCRY